MAWDIKVSDRPPTSETLRTYRMHAIHHRNLANMSEKKYIQLAVRRVTANRKHAYPPFVRSNVGLTMGASASTCSF